MLLATEIFAARTDRRPRRDIKESVVSQPQQAYLDLMKTVLTNMIYEDEPIAPDLREAEFDHAVRSSGMDWPSAAHTMVGLLRLENVHRCMERVVSDGVPGDFIETGVWRGGVCIFMRAFLKAHDIADRRIWVADSFQGIPDPGPGGHPLDVWAGLHRANSALAVPLDVVRENFSRYGLLDEQVTFLPGWFAESLPAAPIRRLAMLRLDGDLYASTADALRNLYPKLSSGGFVIVDDYGVKACRAAVEDFRRQHAIADPIEIVDEYGAFWRRTA
jgi:hypothetical protein